MAQTYKLKKTRKAPPKSRRRWLLIGGILLLVIAAAGGTYWKLHDSKPASSTSSKKTTTDTADNNETDENKPKIDYSPPTPQDKTAVDEHKDQLVKQQNDPGTPTGNNAPVITFAGKYESHYEVSAYVPGIVEDGGTCTLTATLGGKTITKQTIGVRNAKDTSCPTFSLERSEFPSAGTWTVKVSYKSAAHNGTSGTKSVKVD